MQPRQRTFHQTEARGGDLGRRREIEQAETLAEIDMVTRRERERARLSEPTNLDIVVGAASRGHRLVRNVRNAEQEVRQLGLQRIQARLVALQLVGHRRYFGHERACILALLLRLTDLFRCLIAPRLQLLSAGLQRLALRLEHLEALGVEGHAAIGEPARDGIDVIAK